MAQKEQTSVNTPLTKIKGWYDGYQLSEECQSVYSPFSILVFFAQKTFKTHWFGTGTPDFLISLIQAENFSPMSLECLEVFASGLQNYGIGKMGLVALLYQTGYLTILSYDPKLRMYKLGYPNFKVREAFNEVLLRAFTKTSDQMMGDLLRRICDAVEAKDYKDMFEALKKFISAMPYELHQPREVYYQSIFYKLFKMINFRVGVETSTNVGRTDAVIELEDWVLIFEFKLNQTAEVALAQIHDKHYC